MRRPRRGPLLVLALAAGVIGAVVVVFALRGANEPPPVSLPRAEGPRGAAPSGTLAPTEGSFVGYRVRETFASIGVTTAVGRTSAVEGTAELRGDRITRARFGADLRTLRSDEARRDSALQTRGLESARFPTARFELTRPLALAPRATARGRLTLHGVTRPVRVRVAARRSAAGVDLAGSAPIRFGDYEMEPPSIAGFVSVRDQGVLEVRLRLR